MSGTLTVPKGKAPKGGWPVISWAHGTTGIADQCAPSREARRPGAARQLRLPAAAALAEGRLRGRAHRLRGPRHAGRPPVPDRPLGGPLGARRGARGAQARQAARQARRASPATRRAASRRCGRRRWRRSTRPTSSSAARSRSRRSRTSPSSRPRCTALTLAQRAERPGRDDPARHRHRAARRLGVPGVAQRPRGGAVPADADRVPRPADEPELVRRLAPAGPAPPGRRSGPARRARCPSSTTPRI